MATSRWKTAGALVNDAAVECNLSEVVDPFASTDQNFKLFVRLLNSCGRELMQHTPVLQSLIREAVLTMTPGDSGIYTLPDDFVSLTDRTAWDRTSHWPAIGPISGPEWQTMQGLGLAGLVIGVPWRIRGIYFETYPQPVAAAASVAVEYVSRAWVQPATSSVPDSDEATLSSDLVMYEPLLMQRALKYHWKGERGFDVTKALADYETSLSAAESAAPARVIDLTPGGSGIPLVGDQNLPATGWGQ